MDCSPATVRRLARILLADELDEYRPGCTGNRVLLTHEQVARLERVLARNRQMRSKQVAAGRARWRRHAQRAAGLDLPPPIG
jgi:hypothetical protein